MALPSNASDRPSVSVVIPALNEGMNITALIGEIVDCLTPITDGFEIIVVDDGSDDDTGDQALTQGTAAATVRVLRHVRRHGQSAAVLSGVRAAQFEWIVTLDGDGQNDPASIPALLSAAVASSRPGLVGGLRSKRQDSVAKRWASRFANHLRQAVLDDGCADSGCGLKVFSRAVFLQLPYFNAMHRFLPALFKIHGHPTQFLPVEHRPRQGGRSKYGQLKRGAVGFIDLLGVGWLRLRTRVAVAEERTHESRPGQSDVQSD